MADDLATRVKDELAYLRRDKHAGLESVNPENDYILSKDGPIAGLENETYWFTFDIPELNIQGNTYIWTHSQLRTCTAHVLIFQGVKRHVWQAEHFNCFQFLPYPDVTEDSVSAPELGLKVRIVKPHEEHELTYDDPGADTRFSLRTMAILPAVKAQGRNHLEQPMHVTGELVLNGVKHKVDSYSFRDRSWRGKRPESNTPMPPMTYSNGITSDGKIAFNFCGADDPALGVDWHERYPLTPDQLLLEGWVHRDGQLSKVVRMSKKSEIDQADFKRLLGWVCELEDELGRITTIRAHRKAALPFCPWASLYNDWGQFGFTIDGGGAGHCVTNDFFTNHYARTITV